MDAEKDVHFYGNRSAQKSRRANGWLLVSRAFSFSFSLASVIVMGTNVHTIRGTQSKVAWHEFDPYR